MFNEMFTHRDILEGLYSPNSAKKKLEIIHQAVIISFDFIVRIGVALYDEKTDLLHTYIFSEIGWEPVEFYESHLSESITLQETANRRQPRMVNDLAVFDREFTQEIYKVMVEDRHYKSVYTLPILHNDTLHGFIFFNSPYKDSFSEPIMQQLDVFGSLIGQIVMAELNAVKLLLSFFELLLSLIHEKDPETANHLERVTRYSRLIALDLAKSGMVQLTDESIKFITEFAALHDLGKIIIPDNILFKPARLNDEEWKTMKTHSQVGGTIVERVAQTVGPLPFGYADIARYIPQYHHENIDGSGYPEGLTLEEIPIEARIVAVADVFDALTSERPYKEAWTNEDALIELENLCDYKLDRHCVEALVRNMDKVVEIQRQFKD